MAALAVFLALYWVRQDNVSMSDATTKGLFKSLEGMYTKGDFEEAIALLLKNKDGFEPGLFHYNLGTLYTKVENLAAGRYHLEKALSKGFVNTMAINNLSAVKQKLKVQDISHSESFYDQWMDKSLMISDGAYLTFTLALTVIGLFFIKLKVVRNKFVIGAMVLMALLPIGYSQLYLKNVNFAVALKSTKLFDGPSEIYFHKGDVVAGSKVIVGKDTNGWFLIEHPLNLAGWIKKESLGFY